ncbi:unnamed protein product [Arctogadus glacialis]
MGLCVWICVLYSLLQAGVLSQTLHCPPWSGRGCVQGLTTNDADEQKCTPSWARGLLWTAGRRASDRQSTSLFPVDVLRIALSKYADNMEPQRPRLLSGAERHSLGLMRRQRDHEPRRTPHHLSPHHLNPAGQPGAVTARGFPNTLIQADRGRRHLPAPTSGKKVKRRPRAGSFSLIVNNNPSAPLQVGLHGNSQGREPR